MPQDLKSCEGITMWSLRLRRNSEPSGSAGITLERLELQRNVQRTGVPARRDFDLYAAATFVRSDNECLTRR